MKKLALSVAVVLGLMVSGAAFGVNITIPDEHFSGTGWYGAQEDQEVETGCITGQAWDLEGFFMNGSTLTMAGGIDFINGVQGYNITVADMFFDVDGDAQYGSGTHAPANYNPGQFVTDLFGYDFAMDIDWAHLTYSVYDIRGGALLETVSEQINDCANPWRLSQGGELVRTGQIAYQNNLTDANMATMGYGVVGGWHNVASVDVSWLTPYLENGTFVVHATERCGNDNLMGTMRIVPEPSTLVLLGLGLTGMIFRKRFCA